jgi:hypothetical protein
MQSRTLFPPLLFGALLLGCVGNLGGDDPGDTPAPPGPSTSAFACKAGLTPSAVPLRRLSRLQYLNTLDDLLKYALPGEAAAVMTGLDPIVAAIPIDEKQGPSKHFGGFTRLAQAVSQEQVEGSYAVANAVGAALTSTPARLAKVAGACATDADASNDVACLDAFISSFGERALHRAITPDDLAFYKKVAGAAPFDAADFADVIGLLLAAPEFLYFVESGKDAVAGSKDLYTMSAYELASRLSYHFWQTMPDEELLTHARSGDLTQDAVFEAQVKRMFTDPRTRTTITSFYDEWLHRDDVAELTSRLGTPAFDTLRGKFTPSPALRESMFTEIVDMATHYSLDTKGTIDDLYTSRKSFAKDEKLAEIYGVPVWDGKGEPPSFVEPERQGLLTRAGMVATGSVNTRPVMKGVFIRRALLCDELPPPPANANAKPLEPSGDLTAREEIAALTETGICAGCHATVINALGYSTENFDAIGRFRTKEMLIDGASGLLKGTKPVDTSATPHVVPKDDRVAKDSRDVSAWMLESGKAQACFARVYFRFTFGRAEDVNQDACALADLDAELEKGTDLGAVLSRVALSPAFRQRNFGE